MFSTFKLFYLILLHLKMDSSSNSSNGAKQDQGDTYWRCLPESEDGAVLLQVKIKANLSVKLELHSYLIEFFIYHITISQQCNCKFVIHKKYKMNEKKFLLS